MPRIKTKYRTPISLNLSTEIVEQLRQTSNASNVVNDILIMHCERIGTLTKADKRNLIREELREFAMNDLKKLMKDAYDKMIEEFLED